MSKTIWYPGTPTVSGIYWFDNGLGFDWQKKKDRHPMVLQVAKGDNVYLFGDYGSGPLSSFYSEKLCPNAKWAHIEQPYDWQEHDFIKGRKNRAWVKHPKGYIGFGLLEKGWHDDVGGTIVWLDHPTTASGSGMWIKRAEGYLYSPVKMPKI